eukprot:77319-Lingulodinium_polyedra.AAC.1
MRSTLSAPGPLGGCGLQLFGEAEAAAAYWSSWLCTRDAVQHFADVMGGKLRGEPDAGAARRAAGVLEQHGVE